jgi:hypothetical protein
VAIAGCCGDGKVGPAGRQRSQWAQLGSLPSMSADPLRDLDFLNET